MKHHPLEVLRNDDTGIEQIPTPANVGREHSREASSDASLIIDQQSICHTAGRNIYTHIRKG